ncbi:uncharacterized protein LOC106474832 [Limulus polyphemus]|uniref:Uncharacterized protein LOC106474832 n=1 Tax=Limulus polyphemus TaxID=6850 RepID=A0ABM1BYA6_LIMPO|nr:uncharacterized protein LOC106474832 [Limulus polyphemus]
MKRLGFTACLAALCIAISQGVSPPFIKQTKFSTCPLGWSSCRYGSDCPSPGCCATIDPGLLKLKCCVPGNYLTVFQAKGRCPSAPIQQSRCPNNQFQQHGGRQVVCPYIQVRDLCRNDEQCNPINSKHRYRVCCPYYTSTGCYKGRRCEAIV